MWLVAWVYPDGTKGWDLISGEEARDVFIEDLIAKENVHVEEINVFDMEDEIDNKQK